jgi:hypothetical protein
MSARAGWRLESLGFSSVFRYTPGKADWIAFALPTEGRDADVPRAGQIARRDVPTCSLHERVGEIRDRVEAAEWDECLVINAQRVVLGRLRGAALGVPTQTIAEEVMEAGPTTIRPDESLATLVPRLRDRRVARIIVTTPDGRLVGVAERRAAEEKLAAYERQENDRD